MSLRTDGICRSIGGGWVPLRFDETLDDSVLRDGVKQKTVVERANRLGDYRNK